MRFSVDVPDIVVQWWNKKWFDFDPTENTMDFLTGVIECEEVNHPRRKAKLLDQIKLWNLRQASK